MKREPFLIGFLGAVAGLVLGYLMGSQGSAPSGAEQGAQLELLHADLQAIKELLAREGGGPAIPGGAASLPENATPESVAGIERRDVERFREDLGEAVAGLRAAVSEFQKSNAILATWNQDSSTRHSPLRDETPKPMDGSAVQRIRDTLQLETTETPPEFFGLSAAQVYQRLGTPSWVNTNDGRVRWYYKDPLANEELLVTFIDGYVVWLLRSRQ